MQNLVRNGIRAKPDELRHFPIARRERRGGEGTDSKERAGRGETQNVKPAWSLLSRVTPTCYRVAPLDGYIWGVVMVQNMMVMDNEIFIVDKAQNNR